MWTYVQKTGELFQDGRHEAFGYSGHDDPITGQQGKNNPDLQNVLDIGPIPVGRYAIGNPEDTVKHGPFVLPLTPDASNEMFGRSEFLIHGDKIGAPGTASQGCVIMNREVRDDVADSRDRLLEVISGEVEEAKSA